ncbi:MAG: ester cyclase [Actinobacteria bacterium]|nr:ester cyclase [Actinomycetota bacterium]
MSVEENKALIRRLFEEVINAGDLDRAGEFLGAGFVEHNPIPGQAPGIEGFKQVIAMLRVAFPDLRITVEDLIGERDKVSVRLTVHGAHRGEFQGIPPTNRQVAWAGISIIRIAEGKVVERWFQSDVLGLRQQLGAVPPAGRPQAPTEGANPTA